MSGYWEALYDFEQTSYPTALLFPTLPYYLSLLPAIFRLFAFLTILPVLLLAGGDLFGWTVFKFVLRPLGYASTIRFKDPEPPSNLIAISNSITPSLAKKRSSQYFDLTTPVTSIVAPITALSQDSDDDEEDDGDSSSPVSYTTSLAASTATSPTASSHPTLSIDPTLVATTYEREGSVDSTGSIERHRANSVGVDGPLFGLEGSISPDLNDDVELPIVKAEGEKEKVKKGGVKLGMTKVAA